MTLPWFRMYAEFAGDPTVQSLAFEDQRHFVVLLCLKCDGVLDRAFASNQVRDRVICRSLGLDPVSAAEAKRRLMDVTLIDSNWQIPSWERRQYLSDNSTQRTRKYRKNKKQGNVTGTSRERHCDGPDSEAETETEIPPPKPPPLPKKSKLAWGLPDAVDPRAWADFEAHRKDIRKPLTDLSRKANAKILANLTPVQQREAVETTIANRWTGIFPPKTNGATHADKSLSAAEQRRADFQELARMAGYKAP